MLSLKRPSFWVVVALTASLLLLLGYFVSAQAETAARILNLDSKDHKVTVGEGDKTGEFSLAPNQEVGNICASECWIAIDGNEDTYDIAAFDRIVIEQGQLFYQENEESGLNQKEDSEEESDPEPTPKPDEGEGQ